MNYSLSNVKMHHDLVGMYGEMWLQAQRVLNCLLIKVDQDKLIQGEDKDRFKAVDIRRYAELGDMSIGEAYNEIVKTIEVMRVTPLKFPISGGGIFTTSIIHSHIAQEDPYLVFIDLDKALVPMLSGELPSGQFLLADPIMDSLKSSKRYTFYLHVKKQLWKLKKQPSFIVPITDVRVAFGLSDNQYPETRRIVEKLIKPALKDIQIKLGIALKAKATLAGIEISYAN
jgi:hypothetical protein